MLGWASWAATRHLALKALHGFPVVRLLADDLQGARSGSSCAAGLENLAHAAFAQDFQQDVRPDDKVLARMLQQLTDLILRQPVLALQILGNRGQVWIADREILHRNQLRIVQQIGFAQLVDQGGERCDGHGDGDLCCLRLAIQRHSRLPACILLPFRAKGLCQEGMVS